MSSTLPRIIHGDSVAGYGWRLSDALWEEAEYTIDDLSFHADDLPMVRTHYQGVIDDMQAAALQQVIGADIYRYIVYILKFLELMSVELGLRTMDESVILSHEADAGQKAELAATWAEKSGAWLNVVGVAEREASAAKKAISAANNDSEMRAIAEGFPAALSEALQ